MSISFLIVRRCAVALASSRTRRHSERSVEARLQRARYRDIRVEFKDFLIPGIPSFLIRPSILFGAVLERILAANRIAQSLFISAEK
jgi:hypothetical protein